MLISPFVDAGIRNAFSLDLFLTARYSARSHTSPIRSLPMRHRLAVILILASCYSAEGWPRIPSRNFFPK